MLAYFIAIWSNSRLLGIVYGNLVYFTAIWYILLSFGTFFPRFGKLYQGKSGNPALKPFFPLENFRRRKKEFFK
jgi:hypothetical protein